jgi:curli biogenesis system outer membrane secretion channel CsgG
MRWGTTEVVLTALSLALAATGAAQVAPVTAKPLQPFDKTGVILSITDTEIDLQTSKTSAATEKIVFVRTHDTKIDDVKDGDIVRVIYFVQDQHMIARSVTSRLTLPPTKKGAEPLGVAQSDPPSSDSRSPATVEPAGPPIRVAIAAIEVSPTSEASFRALSGTNQDFGSEVAESLSDTLGRSGRTTVIEGSALQKIMREQNLSNSDHADLRVYKPLGVDAVLIGNVSQVDIRSVSDGSASSHQVAHVELSSKLIDVRTGAIIWTGVGEGFTSNPLSSTLGPGLKGGPSQQLNVRAAIDAAGRDIATKLGMDPGVAEFAAGRAAASYAGLVADVTGKTLILTFGTSSGVKVGDMVEIIHPVRTVKNPETGAVMKSFEDSVGLAIITEADPGSARATYLGTGAPAVNDKAKLKP